MTRLSWKLAGGAFGVAALLAMSTQFADAAPTRISGPTNLRQGPGLNFGVIATVPAGSVVDVIRCGPEWCNVSWGGRPGYMIARNLGVGGPGPGGVGPGPVAVAPPPPVVVEPYPYYGPYYGPGFYYGPGYYYRRWGWRRW
jgi:uncharacterized protein YraI